MTNNQWLCSILIFTMYMAILTHILKNILIELRAIRRLKEKEKKWTI